MAIEGQFGLIRRSSRPGVTPCETGVVRFAGRAGAAALIGTNAEAAVDLAKISADGNGTTAPIAVEDEGLPSVTEISGAFEPRGLVASDVRTSRSAAFSLFPPPSSAVFLVEPFRLSPWPLLEVAFCCNLLPAGLGLAGRFKSSICSG